MPIANVSDIVGQRDLVKEAQGWADLRLKNKELQAKEAKEKQKTKPKPYNFNTENFGSKNPHMFDLQQGLNQQMSDYTLANAELLRMTPGTEDCGPECMQAHKVLNNMNNAAKMFTQYGDNLQGAYDERKRLMEENPDAYENDENMAALDAYIGAWNQGIGGEGFDMVFNEQGQLVVNKKTRKKVQATTDENGETVQLWDNGTEEGTTDKSQAIMENGKPKPLMMSLDTGETTDFDVNQMSFNQFIDDIGFNKPISNIGQQGFDKTITSYSELISRNPDQNLDPKKAYNEYNSQNLQKLEAYIYSSEGRVRSHSKYLEKLLQQERLQDDDPNNNFAPITKDDIVGKAYELAMGKALGDDKMKDTKKDTIYDFYKEDIGGGYFENPDDINSSFIGVKHTFEGSAFGAEGGGISFEIDVKPSNVSLLSGDAQFRKISSKTDLPSYDAFRDFNAKRYGVALFYKGRAISDDEFAKLEPKEKAKAKYQTAMFGQLVLNLGDKQQLEKLIGKNYIVDGDEILVEAVVPSGVFERTVGSKGSTKEGSGKINEEMVRDAAKLAEERQDEHDAAYGAKKEKQKGTGTRSDVL